MSRGVQEALELLSRFKMCWPELQWRLCIEKGVSLTLNELDGLIKTMLRMKAVELFDDPYKVVKDIVITEKGRGMI